MTAGRRGRKLGGAGRGQRTAYQRRLAVVVAVIALSTFGHSGVRAATAAAPAQVERVRYESDGLSTRVIVMLSRAVPHEVRTLPGDPARGSKQRLVIDLSNAKLGRAARVPMGADHGILQRIRTGQFTERTARVVLDLAGKSTYEIRAYPEPARLVIDVVGEPGTVLARRAPSPRAKAPAPPRAVPPPAKPAIRREAPAVAATKPIDDAANDARRAPEAPRVVATPAAPDSKHAAVRRAPAVTVTPAGPPSHSSREQAVAAQPTAALEPEIIVAAATPAAKPKPEQIAAAHKARRAVLPPPIGAAGAPWRIVLDPGHGGHDPGAEGVDGLLEKDVVLRIAHRLKKRIESELNAIVLLTRDGDETRSLADRTAFANASRADLFVSIHANADEAGRLQGIETYTLNNSNDRATIRLANMENGPQLRLGRGDLSFILSDMVQSSKEEESITLAQRVHARLLGRLRARYPDVRNLGVKKGPFYVLVGAYMPCVLIETSFLTHPVEGKRLAQQEYQSDIAEGLFLGMRDFLADARLAKTL